MRAPILILGTPRSGSSMTAGVFARHGVWVGTCREPSPKYNPKGFFENRPIKHIIMRRYPKAIAEGKPIPAECGDGMRAEVEEALRRDGYERGPWCWKGSARYWPAWHEFRPWWVLCRRDPESTFSSCRESRMLAPNKPDPFLRQLIRDHHKDMDHLAERGGVNVDTEAVAMGDFSSLEEAFDYCGVAFDPAIAREFVESSYWHYRSSV